MRLATARPEPDGSVRFKATLRVGDGASTYTLDGRLADLMGKPRIDGELTARLPIAGLWHAPQRGSARAQRQDAGGELEAAPDRSDPAFDLKANVNTGPAGATLSDLALAFEQDGRPQLVTGELKALWRDAFAVDMSLSSRWLDLDRIAGAGEAAGPLDSLVPLAMGMRDLLPAEGRSRATFAIDQANVGREAVSNVRLSLARSRGQARDRGVSPRHARRQPRRAAGRRLGPARGAEIRRQLEPARERASSASSAGRPANAAVVRRQGRRRVRRPLAALDRGRQRGGAQCHRRPVGNHDSRRRAISLGGAAGAFPAAREPAARRARIHPGRIQPRRHLRSRLARADRAPGRGTGHRPGQARLARRPDRRPHPRQRRAAHHGFAHLSRRDDGDRAQGRPPQVAAAARCGRRRLQPRARGRGGECRYAAEGHAARRGRRRFGAGYRAVGGLARHSRRVPPRRQTGAGHGAAAPGRIDVARRAHADLCRSRARRRDQRRGCEAQRPTRWRRRPVGARGPPISRPWSRARMRAR